MKKIYAEITEYKGKLVIEHKETKSDHIVTVPNGSNIFGYVIKGIDHVAISKEAHNLLKKIKRGRDCIGDIDIFEIDDGGYAFATIGGMYRIIDVEHAEGSRSFVIPGINEFQIIENNAPEGARHAIDEEN